MAKQKRFTNYFAIEFINDTALKNDFIKLIDKLVWAGSEITNIKIVLNNSNETQLNVSYIDEGDEYGFDFGFNYNDKMIWAEQSEFEMLDANDFNYDLDI